MMILIVGVLFLETSVFKDRNDQSQMSHKT